MRSARSSTAPFLLLLITSASAQFGPEFQYFCEAPRSVDLVDVDGDGSLDLVVGSRQGLGVYLNSDGQGTMDQPFFVGTEETVACVGDLNGDGAPDILGSREQNGGLYVHFNDGAGAFTETYQLSASLSADEMHCADLDADGYQDAIFVLPTGQLAISYNYDGDGELSEPRRPRHAHPDGLREGGGHRWGRRPRHHLLFAGRQPGAGMFQHRWGIATARTTQCFRFRGPPRTWTVTDTRT
jgi:hypothetical protein